MLLPVFQTLLRRHKIKKNWSLNIKFIISNNFPTIKNLVALHTQSTALLPMDTVFIRHEGDDVCINFHYVNKLLGIDREFSFNRKKAELVNISLARIRGSIIKEIEKSQKRSKKKSVVRIETPKLPVDFCKADISLADVSLGDLIAEPNDVELRIEDNKFKMVVNKPWIKQLLLPSQIYSGAIVYPRKVELQFTKLEYCKAKWFRSPMPKTNNLKQCTNWEFCSDSIFYRTTVQDINCILKLILIPTSVDGISGPEFEVLTPTPVKEGPQKCPFIERHNYTRERLEKNEFRVVSYNILADLYADSEKAREFLFAYCAKQFLDIDYRKQLYLQEIVGYNADIICLQEVDSKVFKYDLNLTLESPKFGFKGVLQEKQSAGEGAAIFYRADRYELIPTTHGPGVIISSFYKEFPETKELWEKISANEELLKRISNRGTVFQTAVLRCKENGRILLVGNTHLFFHPDADHIRLLQFGFTIIYLQIVIKELLEKNIIKNERDVSIIYCGDFNSVPSCGIYKLATQKFVEENFVDFRSNAKEAVENISFSHSFELKSAYGEPKFTNYTDLFKDCLDYIFYQSDRIDLIQTVPLPDENVLNKNIAIPSEVFPSDHLALIADFRFK